MSSTTSPEPMKKTIIGGINVYPYHNRIKKRIKSGEMIYHYFTEDYPGIGEALVIVFKNPPFSCPIRPEKWEEYTDIIKKEVGKCN